MCIDYGFINPRTQPNLAAGRRLFLSIKEIANIHADNREEASILIGLVNEMIDAFNRYKIQERDPVTEDMSDQDLNNLYNVICYRLEFNQRQCAMLIKSLIAHKEEVLSCQK